MEKQTDTRQDFTKAEDKNALQAQSTGLAGVAYSGSFLLSSKDAAEYRAYKKQKKVAEIMSALARSEGVVAGGEDVQRICERALRLKQAAVKLTPTRLAQTAEFLSPKVKIDCIIGGNGETLTKVKAYEAKQAIKRMAGELTLVVPPSMLSACRYTELRREIKRMRRVAKKVCLKVYADGKIPQTTLSRLARICSETEVDFLSVPYFLGCEKLRFDLTGKCKLEVSEVETLADYQKMIQAGVGRIVTKHIGEIYSEWMKEADKVAAEAVREIPMPNALPVVSSQGEKKTEGKAEEKAEEKKPPTSVTALIVAEEKKTVEQGKAQKDEGKELKFV